MAEPQGDLTDVSGRLERVHRAAMAENVRGHPLARDRGLYAGRGDDMLGEDILEPRPGHCATDAVEEQREIVVGRANREPGPDSDRCLLPQVSLAVFWILVIIERVPQVEFRESA